MTEETVRYRAPCPIADCAGLAWWFGRVADSGGGTTYRVLGCSLCGRPENRPYERNNPTSGRVNHSKIIPRRRTA